MRHTTQDTKTQMSSSLRTRSWMVRQKGWSVWLTWRIMETKACKHPTESIHTIGQRFIPFPHATATKGQQTYTICGHTNSQHFSNNLHGFRNLNLVNWHRSPHSPDTPSPPYPYRLPSFFIDYGSGVTISARRYHYVDENVSYYCRESNLLFNMKKGGSFFQNSDHIITREKKRQGFSCPPRQYIWPQGQKTCPRN